TYTVTGGLATPSDCAATIATPEGPGAQTTGATSESQVPPQAKPPLEIVKTAVLLEVNVIGTATLVLLELRAAAVNWRVAPKSRDALVAGVIVTNAGGCTGEAAPVLPQPVMPPSSNAKARQARNAKLHRPMHPPRSQFWRERAHPVLENL